MSEGNRRPRGSGPRGGGRRPPPPDETGIEMRYLQRLKEDETQLVVQLVNGESHVGRIEYFDGDMIKLTTPDGPNVFVRKADIRYLYDELEPPGGGPDS